MALTNVLNEPYNENKMLAHVTVTNMHFLSFCFVFGLKETNEEQKTSGHNTKSTLWEIYSR